MESLEWYFRDCFFFSLKAFGPSRLLASFAEALNLPQAGKAVSIFGFGAFSYLWLVGNGGMG